MIKECVLQLEQANILFRFLAVDPQKRWGYVNTEIQIKMKSDQTDLFFSTNPMFEDIYEFKQLVGYFTEYLEKMKQFGPSPTSEYTFIPMSNMFHVFMSDGDQESGTFSTLFLVNPNNPYSNLTMVGLQTIGSIKEFEIFLIDFKNSLKMLEELAERH